MFNFKTKKAYSGQNVATLMGAGFTSEYWMTYKQAQEMGYQVRRGSTGERLMKVVEKEVLNKKTGKLEKKKLPKTFVVFNMEQMDLIDENAPEVNLAVEMMKAGEVA
mgnify:CR=1 FL=1